MFEYFLYLSPRMMKALALLLEELSAHESSHFDLIAGLSGLVLEGLKHSCQPDLDTVEVKLIHNAYTNPSQCLHFVDFFSAVTDSYQDGHHQPN